MPDVILFLLGAHYTDERLFQSQLSNDLLPAFQKLLKSGRTNDSRKPYPEIIWVNQQPLTQEQIHPYPPINLKMQRFNKMAYQIFK